MAVTAKDVAQRAGVSQATVSYILNDAPNQTISVTTRESVLRVAKELGYRPNSAARSLRLGHGPTVVFPMPGEQRTHVYGQLIDACSNALDARELTLVTDFTRYDDPQAQLDAWTRLHPAAVIDLLLHRNDPILTALRNAGVNVLSADAGTAAPDESTTDRFAFQNRYLQLDYLLDGGHRRIAAVGPHRPPIEPSIDKGYFAVLSRHARQRGGSLRRSSLDLTARPIRQYAESLATGKLQLDAILTYNDDYAIGLITSLSARGIRVPDDVAVIGVNDIPMAACIEPSLTTIAFDFEPLARGLADAIVDQIQGLPSRGPLPLPERHLVVRESA